MYILTNKNNVIIYISTEAVLKSDGIHVGSNQIFSDKTLQILSTETIDAGVVPQKYCYTEQKGFYLNESYQPVNPGNGNITEKVDYIINKIEPIVDENALSLEEMIKLQISRVGAQCDAVIDAGTDVTLSNGTVEHFSLTIKDQKNIDKIMLKVEKGMLEAWYHSDSNQCKAYSAADLILLSFTSDMFLFYNTTYANSLNTWIRRCTTKEQIKQIYFGATLPVDLQETLDEAVASSMAELNRLKAIYGL